jgi:hypothetical protein
MRFSGSGFGPSHLVDRLLVVVLLRVSLGGASATLGLLARIFCSDEQQDGPYVYNYTIKLQFVNILCSQLCWYDWHMTQQALAPKKNQLVFHELFVGTLIYVLVLGLFADYTSVVSANSFSTIVYASAILQILTYLAFVLKGEIVARLKHQQGLVFKILMVFSVWLVMFLSKFVFIAALGVVLGEYITVYGFFGILAVVVSVTAVHRLAQFVFAKLG